MSAAGVAERLDGCGVFNFVVRVVDDVCFVGGGDEFADGFVRDRGHEEELDEENEGRDDEVEEEEGLYGEGAVRALIDEAVDEEDGARSVEGAG